MNVPPFAIATSLVSPSAVAFFSALAHHLWHAAGPDFRYVTVVPKRFDFGIEQVWVDERFRVLVTDRERTVLDLFALPERCLPPWLSCLPLTLGLLTRGGSDTGRVTGAAARALA